MIILAYSLRKINTNPKEAYSILNPETNSDSPSEKSNGVRLVSATAMTNHKALKGKDNNTIEVENFEF